MSCQLELDRTLLWTYISLRSAVDVFYAIHFLISLRRRHYNRNTSIDNTTLGTDQRDFLISLRGYYNPNTNTVLGPELLHFLYLILVGFPLPEGLILTYKCLGFPIYDRGLTCTLIISTPIQYSLRIFHVYRLLRLRRPIFKNEIGNWLLRAILDFLPFILASHLFGALWYRLAVQRQIECWKQNCDSLLGTQFGPQKIRSGYFYCENLPSTKIHNISKWDELCPVKEAHPEVFDFGIYLFALQSNATGSTHFVRRELQSFWWALRNLSSFGSNLQTSMYSSEIFLSVLISVSGMVLFLVYLNARVQFKLGNKNTSLKRDIDSWLQKIGLPSDRFVLKKAAAIMENIHKVGDGKDINWQNMLSSLPMKDQKSIICLLFFDSLKKVWLENIKENDNTWREICKHLKPMTYAEDSYIVKEGRPQGKMLFIVQGSAYTYTTSNINNVETSNGWLNSGDFYGQELISWAFKSPPISDLPISTRTVMCQEKIEAFVIRASDLKKVASSDGCKEVRVSQLD